MATSPATENFDPAVDGSDQTTSPDRGSASLHWHPFAVLDLFLKSLPVIAENADTNERNALCASTDIQQEQKRHDEILHAANFLFSSYILDGALKILEQPRNNGNLVDFGPSIVRMQSPRRFMYVVQSSITSCWSSSNRPGNSSARKSSFLCILPEYVRNLQYESGTDACYCSCQKFLQATRAASSTLSTRNLVCKHLLALKLMSSLGIEALVEEYSTEADFSDAVVQRLYT